MTSRTFFFLALAVGLVGCVDPNAGADGGTDGGTLVPMGDAGLAIPYSQFTLRTGGWPAGARVSGAALLDGVITVSTQLGVLGLPINDVEWSAQSVPLSGDMVPTSIQRVDQTLVVTAAGTGTGGLFRRSTEGAWAATPGSPTAPCWALVKKGSEWLLATTGGLMVATSLDGPWARRSAPNTVLFGSKVTRLVAAPAQQKLFAAGLPGTTTGGLFESADLGATWVASAPRGSVSALAAGGQWVFVVTATDGQQRSDNYGNTFRPAPTMVTDTILSYTLRDMRLWATTSVGLSYSDDNGATFTADTDGLPANAGGLFFAGSYVVGDTADGPYVNQP